MSEPEIFCQAHGPCGLITLNRPAALNALTHGMVRAIAVALDEWETNPAITRVMIEAAGGKAFCAGGDVRALYRQVQAGDFDTPMQFWADEYRLNQRIKRYPKPYVALVDGMVMGGGAGISINGSHVVAGDRFALAMPEVGIGFFPDVGATFFLSRLPGLLGTWMALTGTSIDAPSALRLKLAHRHVSSAGMAGLKAALMAGADVAEMMSPPHAAGLAESGLPQVEAWFAGADLAEIFGQLEAAAAAGNGIAFKQAEILRKKSPTSLAIALLQMQRGRSMSFEQALQTEYRIVSRLVRSGDFIEGVRAAVIDKDRQPRWSPASIHGIRTSDIEAFLRPCPAETSALTHNWVNRHDRQGSLRAD